MANDPLDTIVASFYTDSIDPGELKGTPVDTRASTPNQPKIYLVPIAFVCVAVSVFSFYPIRETIRSYRLLGERADPIGLNLEGVTVAEPSPSTAPWALLPTIVSMQYGDPPLERLYKGMPKQEWILNIDAEDPSKMYLVRLRVFHKDYPISGSRRFFAEQRPIGPKFSIGSYWGGFDAINLPLGKHTAEVTIRNPTTKEEVVETAVVFLDYSDEEYARRVGFHLRSQGIGLHENGSSTIDVLCVDRAITLRGWVATKSDRRRASEVAHLAPTPRTLGVGAVENLLNVHVDYLDAAFGA